MIQTVPALLQRQVVAKVDACVAAIEKNYGVKMPKINIKYDLDSTRIGGQAIYSSSTVRFNPIYLNTHTDKYLRTTVVHEVVHLGVFAAYGGRMQPHGIEWKMMMRVLGAQPNRCHSYTHPAGIFGKEKAKYGHKCSVCNETVMTGPKVHTNIEQGGKYFHKACGRNAMLLPVGAAGPKTPTPKTPTPRAPTPRTPTPRAPTPRQAISKIDQCKQIYKLLAGSDRATIINAFIMQARCTPAGAATYFATCKRG